MMGDLWGVCFVCGCVFVFVGCVPCWNGWQHGLICVDRDSIQ
jgi:hypothetical protein